MIKPLSNIRYVNIIRAEKIQNFLQFFPFVMYVALCCNLLLFLMVKSIIVDFIEFTCRQIYCDALANIDFDDTNLDQSTIRMGSLQSEFYCAVRCRIQPWQNVHCSQ